MKTTMNTKNGADAESKTANAPSLGDMLEVLKLLDEVIAMEQGAQKEEETPESSPLDLLSKEDCKRMNTYLENKYGPLRKYIDENYVALLMCLEEYEDVDFDAKISAHIVENIKRS